MNPFDVYKKLPRKNCGKCSAGTCMAFAVQLLRRSARIQECTELDEKAQQEIESMISGPGDWKERRVLELFQELSERNFADIAKGIGALAENDGLRIHYLGRDILLTHTDFVEPLDIFDKLLILMYVKIAGNKSLTGKWAPFRDLKDGLIRSESFHEACEMSLAKMFGENSEALLQKMSALGAQAVSGFSAAHSLVAYPLPKIPFLVLLWQGDDEFEPDCKILFDSTVTDYIDVEALLYLGIALVRAVGS
ncbi:MAG: DUF3786 domain-containing protein [Nitrospiraceae bacterium]|nr:MAG: DUF3786 domain-containing protein [Nitrospiraceae bacterium]